MPEPKDPKPDETEEKDEESKEEPEVNPQKPAYKQIKPRPSWPPRPTPLPSADRFLDATKPRVELSIALGNMRRDVLHRINDVIVFVEHNFPLI